MTHKPGIPALERLIGRMLIRRWCRRHPPARSGPILRDQQRELLSLFEQAGPGAHSRVQIRRLPGLEQSSTNYSLAMIADHLARVNRDLAETVATMARNRQPKIVVEIARYKPDPAAQADRALADLDASILSMEAALTDLGAIARSRLTLAHPWFGELPATTWACFAPFHQGLHLKQARLIAQGLQHRSG